MKLNVFDIGLIGIILLVVSVVGFVLSITYDDYYYDHLVEFDNRNITCENCLPDNGRYKCMSCEDGLTVSVDYYWTVPAK